jgi:hypothetical protein
VFELCDDIDAGFIANTAVFCRERGFMKDMPALLCAVLSVRDQFCRHFEIGVNATKCRWNYMPLHSNVWKSGFSWNVNMEETTVLFRPVGQKELELIRQSGFTQFSPRLPEQPIFYPVLSEEYATQIARDWNAKRSEAKLGYVTRFHIRTEHLKRYQIKTVGGSMHREYWIPAEELAEFNLSIVGTIEVIAEYRDAEEALNEENL